MADLGDAAHIGPLLSAYLDGELVGDEIERVAAHLDGCPECVAEFHGIQTARRALRLLPEVDIPLDLVPAAHLGDWLSAFVDGELGAEEQSTVTRHLERCGDCRDELHRVDAARTAIRALPTLDHPAVAGWAPRSRTGFGTAVGWAAAAAAALAITLGASTATPPTTAVDLDAIAARHATRQAVDPGISVIPVLAPPGDTP